MSTFHVLEHPFAIFVFSVTTFCNLARPHVNTFFRQFLSSLLISFTLYICVKQSYHHPWASTAVHANQHIICILGGLNPSELNNTKWLESSSLIIMLICLTCGHIYPVVPPLINSLPSHVTQSCIARPEEGLTLSRNIPG